MNARLHALKLRALVRDHLLAEAAVEVGEPVDIGVGAAVRSGDDAWVLVEQRHAHGLGIGLAWMQRSSASSLHLVIDAKNDGPGAERSTNELAGALARRARHFDIGISVWTVDERELVPVEPDEYRAESEPSAEHLEFDSVILDCGAEVVIEHGVVSGEVVGLEVCRVVDDPVTGRPRLEVGVGIHDREAFALMHGGTPPTDSLKRIVDVVRGHRRPGADPHPLNRLAMERALRARFVSDATSIGARRLGAVSTVLPRANLKDSVPCAAIGETFEGEPLVAVFSVGIDLDVVPTSADTRAWHGLSDARLVIVVPERDASPVTYRLADALRRPASVIAVPA